jgi:uncharacterized protein YaeQ
LAQPSTLYRFQIDLSDADRGVYAGLELRPAQHPSESTPYLLCRVLAYALNYAEGIAFTSGLSTPQQPAIAVDDLTGTRRLSIEIGNPSAEHLLKASKASERVRVYTYKNPALLLASIPAPTMVRMTNTEIFSFESAFLDEIEGQLGRRNDWNLVHTEGEIFLTVNDHSLHGHVHPHPLRQD